MFLCFSSDIRTGVDTRLTGDDCTTLPTFNLRSDESFGIHTVICHFDSRPKTSDISWFRFARNVVAEDKKLDVEYLLHS
jgi:hypothetical protein